MIRLPDEPLPAGARAWLTELQQTIDAQPTYERQVEAGKELFESKRGLASFRPILTALKRMCSGPQRCCYCEDSQATDVEHIRPKDFYPDLVFVWENYLLACARCNRPKSNTCDIYPHQGGARLKVPAFVKQHGRRPPAGDAVLINPRLEDPLEFMVLEMRDTFFFLPRAEPDTRKWERADHTIRLLKLNEEDVLPRSRAEAYAGYRDRLKRYVDQRSQGEPPETLQLTINSLRGMHHPTVWHEMKRQRAFPHHQEINRLFIAAPEALGW